MINRFPMEAKRQLGVLNQYLADKAFICGDENTIADIAIWTWFGLLVLGKQFNGAELLHVNSYTNLQRGAKLIESRPAVQRAICLP